MEELVIGDVTNCYPLFGSNILSSGNRYYLSDKNDFIITYCRCNQKNSSGEPPLFVDNIWPGAVVLSDYLYETYKNEIELQTLCCIEFGAGCALPSLVISRLGIGYSVITDYPGDNVIENITELIDKNNLLKDDIDNITAKPHIWGCNVDELLSNEKSKNGFDIILVAECLWKDTYSLHQELLTSIISLMSRAGICYVSFAHRPSLTENNEHTKEHDMEFFSMASSKFGLTYEKILTCNKYKDVLEEEFIEVHLYMMKNE